MRRFGAEIVAQLRSIGPLLAGIKQVSKHLLPVGMLLKTTARIDPNLSKPIRFWTCMEMLRFMAGERTHRR